MPLKVQTLAGSAFLVSLLFATAVTTPQADGQGARSTGAGSAWPTYGGNLASHRYSSLDQINKDNFNSLEIAWRLQTNAFGPRPDSL